MPEYESKEEELEEQEDFIEVVKDTEETMKYFYFSTSMSSVDSIDLSLQLPSIQPSSRPSIQPSIKNSLLPTAIGAAVLAGVGAAAVSKSIDLFIISSLSSHCHYLVKQYMIGSRISSGE